MAAPFSWAGLPGVNGTSGASHASEIEFVWQAHALCPLFDPSLNNGIGGCTKCTGDILVQGADEDMLAQTMATYWTNFCRSGDPNEGDAPKTKLTTKWDPWMPADESSLRLDLPGFSAEKGRNDIQCDFIDALGAVAPAQQGMRAH